MAKKNIVYITASVGGGHNMAVQAIMEAIEANFPGRFEHEVFDCFALLGKNFDKLTSRLYSGTTNHTVLAYRAFFELTNKTRIVQEFDRSIYPLITKNLKKILEARPCVIISCFPFLSYSIRKFLKGNNVDIPYITIITDTGEVHSAWLRTDSDFLIAPTAETAYWLEQKGIPKQKIFTVGLPVKQLFYKKYNRLEIRGRYKIPKGNKIILYFTGAYGAGGIQEKLKSLDKGVYSFSIMVVTAKNKTLYDWIERQIFRNQIIPFHYIENVPELMSVADLVITKAGGMSIMETVTMKKPTIVTEVYPGQEEPNAQFIETMGFGYVAKEPDQLVEKVQFIFKESELKRIRENYKNYRLNNRSDKKVARFIVDLLTDY
jgi:processive 1,2-diacylglycerol beta-glucosyltransferase